MDVIKVRGNCSMISIHGNPSNSTTKNGFLFRLYEAIQRYNSNPENKDNLIIFSNVKTIIMTTNQDFWGRLRYRSNLGFTRAYSYHGNSCDKAHVMYLNFKKGLARELIIKGIASPNLW